jgi:hypothetical protein
MKDLELQSQEQLQVVKQEQLQVVKKEWISPEMEEINVNGGIIGGAYERFGGSLTS